MQCGHHYCKYVETHGSLCNCVLDLPCWLLHSIACTAFTVPTFHYRACGEVVVDANNGCTRCRTPALMEDLRDNVLIVS